MSGIKNKLYTKSYFVKRLIDAGYDVEKLDGPSPDGVYWRIVVSPKRNPVAVACYKKSPDDFHFEMVGRSTIKIITRSMDVVIEHLDLLQQEVPNV